jgi:hypothetical protein
MSIIDSLFSLEKLVISYDILGKKVKETRRELLYFHLNNLEESGIFIFGFDFFVSELSEQDFKKHLSSNPLTYKIYNAYHILLKKQKKVKITEIINIIQDDSKDSQKVDEILSRILTLGYYFNWEMEKDPKDLEGDSFVKLPDKYLFKVKQRFNFDVMTSVYENSDLFIFLNSRGKLNVIFKGLDTFTQNDVESLVIPSIKKVFGIKSVEVK